MNVSCALDPRSVSPLWCLSACRSWAAQTSSSSTRALRSTALSTAMCSCQSSYSLWCARYQHNSSSFNRTTPQHTGTRHRANCSLLLPDLWPANSPDLNPVDYRIWSVVQQWVYQSWVHDSDELKQCVQQVWRYVDQSITDNALTSGASVFVHVCRRMADICSICCRKQYDYLQSTIWQHKSFIFVKYDTLSDFVYCNLQ